MAINVTCPGCHTRFKVSDKFGGRTGPCPKCKKPIRIPDKSEEVVIHAPDDGPKDSQGRSLSKPIERKETVLSAPQIALIACTIVGFLLVSLILRTVYTEPENFPAWLIYVGAFALGFAVSYGAYTFLRDPELSPFVGQSLWLRVLVCATVYSLLWFLVPLMNFAFVDLGQTGAFVAIGLLMAAGAGVGMLTFDLDYLTGLLHVGMYVGCCLLCRFLAGIGTIPGSLEEPVTNGPQREPTAWLESLQQTIALLTS